MASRSRRPNGDTWIFAKCSNNKRRPVRLGELSEDDAEEAKSRIAKLEKSFAAGNPPDKVTLAWLNTLPQKLYDRVVATGLTKIDPKAPMCEDRNIDSLIKQWASTLDVEDSTKVNYRMVESNLRSYFGVDRSISSILPADADKFRQWLVVNGRKKSDAPMSRATVSRRCRTIRTIFGFAVKLAWIKINPFGHIKSAGEFNPERNIYVTPRLVDKLIEICTDLELAGMIAACRYGTGRGPSEFANLMLADIDVNSAAIWWTAPKTSRYGDGRRKTEQCEKALLQLRKLYDAVEPGTELVFPRLGSKASSDLSQRLARLCRQIGVPLWVKPWINMRASCETDWQEAGFSIFQTAAWMGHSPEVALRHYNRIAKDRVIDLPNGGGEAQKRSTSKKEDQKRSTRRSNPTSSADNEMSS